MPPHRPIPRAARVDARPALLLPVLLGVLAGWALPPDTPTDQERAEVRRARAMERLGRAPERELPPVDPAAVSWYDATLNELASERMGGRAPGTEGIELAAQLIERRFAEVGLDPLFTDPDGAPSWRQPFDRGNQTVLAASSVSVPALPALEFDRDYTVLGLSGSAEFQGPVAFVGYSIVAGPDGYLNYQPAQRLDGRAALVVRFEPMDEHGRSRWTDEGWTFAASLEAKVSGAVRRGAGAVLLVNPPMADDPRVDRLENLDSTTGSSSFDVPVVMITPDAARALVAKGDPEGRSLEDLIGLANESGVVVDFRDDARVAVSTTIDREPITTSNVGAILRGRGELADEVVVIGAHYDHVGLGRFASRTPERAGEVHEGADDNASGTTAMLLAAGRLADAYAALPPDQPARSVVFLAFTAEESGLIGSRYYVDHPPIPLDRHAAMLNMDMVGRLRDERLEIGGVETSPDLESIASAHLDASGLGYSQDMSIGSGRSDHASFDAKGIPNVFFFTGLHDEYHTADDDPELVNDEGAVRISMICVDLALDLATRADRPRHADADRRSLADQMRPRVRVGVVAGDDGAGPGLVVERVFDGTSASDAGLRPGDRILRWGGESVESLDAWRPMLMRHAPGDVVTAVIERGGEELEVELTLNAPG